MVGIEGVFKVTSKCCTCAAAWYNEEYKKEALLWDLKLEFPRNISEVTLSPISDS